MRMTRILIPAIAICLMAGPIAAQGLGHYPVEDLGILDATDLEVDINLEGSTLQIAIGAMQDEDPRIKDFVSNLTRVRVQVGSPEALDADLVAERIGSAVAQLEAKGWARIISVEDGGERVYVYSIDAGGGMIAGLTALVSGSDEVVVANIAGSIDPVLLGSAMSKMHTVDFDAFIQQTNDDD